MKLQNLLIIFIVIALPVILILSVYIEYQIDTVNMKTAYDSVILGATYDAMTTLQLNTTNNKYSSASDSFIRDMEASINVFSKSFATSLGQTGMSKQNVLTYIPALLYTMYDGYYIYTPITINDKSGGISTEHKLKPYVYYTKEYHNGANGSLVINFSLDNYVVVYLKDSSGRTYTSRAGYLEVIGSKGIEKDGEKIKYRGEVIKEGETLTKNEYTYDYDNPESKTIKSNSFKVTPKTIGADGEDANIDAYKYYSEAHEFTKWYNGIIKNIADSKEKERLYITEDNNPLPTEGSGFNDEKTEVIQKSIEDNLIQAMEMYSRKSGIEFMLPKFTPIDWEQILHNVCVISFVQGFPIGTSTYNNYVIVPSTENKQYVSDKTIYYIGYDKDGKTDGYYHRLGCSHLQGERIVRI